jgi:hypothetical protein
MDPQAAQSAGSRAPQRSAAPQQAAKPVSQPQAAPQQPAVAKTGAAS